MDREPSHENTASHKKKSGKRHGHKKREHNAEEPQDETLPPNISRQETQPFQVGSSGSFPTLHTTGSALARSQSRSHSDHSLKSGSSLHMTSRSHSGSRTLVKSSTSLHHENAPTAKKPAPSKDSVEDIGPPFALLDKSKPDTLQATKEDDRIALELSDVMIHYKGGYQETEEQKDEIFREKPQYTYKEMMKLFKQPSIAIPIPSDEDFTRLESSHGARWDPDGAVVEYYSPVLRSFIPVNMRGRYRGCWTEETCIQGLDISKIKPKPDALEGFVDRGRHVNIEEKYRKMFAVAQDEAHLDYLIEMQKSQAETLPLPLLYDVVNFGVEVLKENLQYLVHKEALPPTNRIYQTTETQLHNLRKKVQIYASLGLEPINGEGSLGKVAPIWRMTRDELISAMKAKRHEQDEFEEKVQFVTKLYEELNKKGEGIPPGADEDNKEEIDAVREHSDHKLVKKKSLLGKGGSGDKHKDHK